MAKKIEGFSHKHSMRGEWFFDETPHETRIGGLQKGTTKGCHILTATKDNPLNFLEGYERWYSHAVQRFAALCRWGIKARKFQPTTNV